MAATYNYQTGQMTRDFKFVEFETKCRLSGLPAYAGSSERCRKCPYNRGSIHRFTNMWGIDKDYIMCNNPEAKDSDNISEVQERFYEMLKNNALCALCY